MIHSITVKKTQGKTKKIKDILSVKPHDHSSELKRLSRIKGQVEGIERMILENRYCPEIAIQIKAIRSALKSLEVNIVENHMRHCVKEAIKSRNSTVVEEKIEEIVLLIKNQDS